MSYLLDFKEKISGIYGGQDCDLTVGSVAVKDKKSEEQVFRKELGGHNRMLVSSIEVIISINRFRTLRFELREFPSCCGKSLLHAIETAYLIYGKDDNFMGQIKDEARKEVCKEIYNLAVKLSAFKGYSSMDFILSSKDNPYFVEAMGDMKIDPVFSFENFRMKRNSPCYNYSVLIPECKQRFEKTDDFFLRENVGI